MTAGLCLQKGVAMHVATQFSVFLVNKPGVLGQVTGAIAKAKINIVALTLMDSSEHGVLRLVCDDPEKARKVLTKSHDHWTETEVLILHLNNEPGAVATVAGSLADDHINISYVYTSGGAPGGRTTCVFKVADMKKAMKRLATGKKPQKAATRRRAPRSRR